MNRAMKKDIAITIAGLALSLLIAASASAGPAGRGEPPASVEEMAERWGLMEEGVALTADQWQQIEPLLEAHMDEMAALRAEAESSGQRPRRGQVKAQMKETRQSIGAYLTEEQAEAWQDAMRERRSEMKGRRRPSQG